MKTIIFFGPRFSKLRISLDDFLLRWESIVMELQEQSNGHAKFVFLLQMKRQNIVSKGEGTEIRFLSENFFVMLLQLFKNLRLIQGKKLLLVGNNIDTLPLGAILRHSFHDVEVQVAVHSDFNALRKAKNWKSQIRFVVNCLLLRRADSLRFVNDIQASIWKKELTLNVRHVTCPVPITIPLTIPASKPRVVAYVGRLHVEREPIRWCHIVMSLAKKDHSLMFQVIGSGPLLLQMRATLSPIMQKITWDGHLEAYKLQQKWDGIRTLLITASIESYGLAAREALQNGVFVVAPNNYANRQLLELAPQQVFLYSEDASAVEKVLETMEMRFEGSAVERIRSSLAGTQARSCTNLVSSWL
jgi:glycosyltransferase involved in cell wall biosynthesis